MDDQKPLEEKVKSEKGKKLEDTTKGIRREIIKYGIRSTIRGRHYKKHFKYLINLINKE